MKTRLIAVLLIFSFFVVESTAQIVNEIRSYVDSTELFMKNGRKLLHKSLEAGDIGKAGNVFNYLNEEASFKKCVVLSYAEELCFYALVSDWERWFKHAQDYLELRNRRMCYNFEDNLSESMYSMLQDVVAMKNREVVQEGFSSEQIDLVNLFMHIVQTGNADEDYYIKARLFLKNYKHSRFSNFVNQYLPTPPTRLGLNMGFGMTSLIPDGKLAGIIHPSNLFNFSYDFFIERFFASMSMHVGATKLKTPIYFMDDDVRVDFAAGEYFATIGGELSGGYLLFVDKKWKLIPYLSIGGYTIETNLYPDYEERQEYLLLDSFFFGPGFQTELRLFNFEWKTNYLLAPYLNGISVGSQKSYISLRFNAGYNFLMNASSSEFKGNFPYLKLGVVWGFGEL